MAKTSQLVSLALTPTLSRTRESARFPSPVKPVEGRASLDALCGRRWREAPDEGLLPTLHQPHLLQRAADMRDALLGVGQGGRFLRVLLGFKHHPAGIAGKLPEHRGVVDHAIARRGIDAELLSHAQDRIEEAQVAGVRFAHLSLAHVLAVDVTDPRPIGAR